MNSGEAALALVRAARRVVDNAYGTSPRHTRAPGGGCRDDCIPCGIQNLGAALAALDGAGCDDSPRPGA